MVPRIIRTPTWGLIFEENNAYYTRKITVFSHNPQDRSAQQRLIDLEGQLSNTRAEVARIKREKEEMERKFNSRLYDLKVSENLAKRLS